MKILNLLFVVPSFLILFASCDKNDNPSSQKIYGKAVALGNDGVRSFLTLNGWNKYIKNQC